MQFSEICSNLGKQRMANSLGAARSQEKGRLNSHKYIWQVPINAALRPGYFVVSWSANQSMRKVWKSARTQRKPLNAQNGSY